MGVCVIELYIPQNRSLKGKRQILRSIKAKISNKFNVAVAEIAEQDRWQTAVLGVSTLSNDRRFVNEVLDKVRRTIVNGHPEVEMGHHRIELL